MYKNMQYKKAKSFSNCFNLGLFDDKLDTKRYKFVNSISTILRIDPTLSISMIHTFIRSGTYIYTGDICNNTSTFNLRLSTTYQSLCEKDTTVGLL